MDFSFSGLFASFVFGVIGVWLIRMAKKRGQYSLLFIGIALIVFTYFTSGPWLTWGIGAGLCLAAYSQWD